MYSETREIAMLVVQPIIYVRFFLLRLMKHEQILMVAN